MKKNIREFIHEVDSTGFGMYSYTCMDEPKTGWLVGRETVYYWKKDKSISEFVRQLASEHGWVLSAPNTYFTISTLGRKVTVQIMTHHEHMDEAIRQSLERYKSIEDLDTGRIYDAFVPSECSTFINYKAKAHGERIREDMLHQRRVIKIRRKLKFTILVIVASFFWWKYYISINHQ